MKYNDVLFLFNYFRGLQVSVHTDPHEVKYRGKNYIFRESHNDLAYHTVTYEFDGDIKGVQIPKEDFKVILHDVAIAEHANIGNRTLH